MTLESMLLSAFPGLRHAFFTRDGGVVRCLTIVERRHRLERLSGQFPRKIAADGAAYGCRALSVFSRVHQTHSPDVVVTSGPWRGASASARRRLVTRIETRRSRYRRHPGRLAVVIYLVDPNAARDGPRMRVERRADRHCAIHRRRHGRTLGAERTGIVRRDRPAAPPVQLQVGADSSMVS